MPTVHAQDTTPLDKVSKPNLKIGIVYLRRFLNLKLRAPRVIFLIKKAIFYAKIWTVPLRRMIHIPKPLWIKTKTYA